MIKGEKVFIENDSIVTYFKTHSDLPLKIQKNLKSLSNKKVATSEPYFIIKEILFYYFINNEKDNLNNVFDYFISTNLDIYKDLDMQFKEFIYTYILIYSEINNSSKYLYFIKENGFVKDRLEGLMVNREIYNFDKEINDLSKSNYFSKDILMQRSINIVTEIMLITQLKKKSFFFNADKKYGITSQKYQLIYVFLLQNYYKKNKSLVEEFMKYL